MNPACRWSLRAQKCDPTCPSPATGPSSTHSEPGNTTRQIHKIHTVNHVPIAPLARVLGGSTLTSELRSPPLPHTRRAAARAEHRGRLLVLEELGRDEYLLEGGAACGWQRTAAPPKGPPTATIRAALSAWRSLSWPVKLSPPAARSAAEAVSKVQKMGVIVHSMAHPHEILPRDLGNSAIAVATVSFFTREKVVLLRKERNQLPAPLWLKSFERRSPQ